MFDIGFSKIIVIFGLALVVLGPEKLPRVAATIGRWVGRARVMARQFRDQLEQESEGLRKTTDGLKEAADSFRKGTEDLRQSADNLRRDLNPNTPPAASPRPAPAPSPVPMTGPSPSAAPPVAVVEPPIEPTIEPIPDPLPEPTSDRMPDPFEEFKLEPTPGRVDAPDETSEAAHVSAPTKPDTVATKHEPGT